MCPWNGKYHTFVPWDSVIATTFFNRICTQHGDFPLFELYGPQHARTYVRSTPYLYMYNSKLGGNRQASNRLFVAKRETFFESQDAWDRRDMIIAKHAQIFWRCAVHWINPKILNTLFPRDEDVGQPIKNGVLLRTQPKPHFYGERPLLPNIYLLHNNKPLLIKSHFKKEKLN